MLPYLIFFLLIEHFEGIEAHSLGSQELERSIRSADCSIYGLKMTTCDLQVSRFGNERFMAKYEKTCNLKDVNFYFHFGKEGKYAFSLSSKKPVTNLSSMKKRLEANKKVFQPGTHFIYVAMKAKSLKNDEMSTSSDKCKFYIRHENATANLGRLNRNVRVGQKFFFDGSRCLNNDLEDRNIDLEFRWKCTSSNSYCEDFALPGNYRVKVPREYATQGARFNITVEVRSLPTSWQSAKQFILVDDTRPFAVNCVQFCGKYPNTLDPNEEGVILAECQFGFPCNKYKKEEVRGALFDDKGMLLATFNNFAEPYGLTMKLEPGAKYLVKAIYGDIKDEVFLGQTSFTVLGVPRLENCKAVPPKGTPLTKFKVVCDYDKETRKNFEIQVKSGETVVFSASATNLEDIEFLVSSKNATVFAKLEDIHDVYFQQQVQVKIHIEDIDLSKSISGVLSMIAQDKRDHASDPDMAKMLSQTCSTVSKQQLYLVENDQYDSISKREISDITNNLMTCSEAEIPPYYEMFNETAIEIQITTPFPINLNLSEKTFEDYPQYVADDLIEMKVNDFLSSAENIMEICDDMGAALIHSFKTDMDKPWVVLRDRSILSVIKTTGAKLVKVLFHQHKVTINPTPFLEKFRSTLSMRVCSYWKDPFWSASQDYKIPTNVIEVSIRDEAEDKDITKFQDQPMNVTFQVFEHLVKKKISRGIVRPTDETSDSQEDDFSIFMIKVRAEESFFVDFLNVGESDNFEVIIVSMERPQLSHFDDPLRLNAEDKKFFVEHSQNTDEWFMLAIRPDEEQEPLEGEVVLEFSVYTPKCVSWDPNKREWKFACSIYITTTQETINCRCTHLSILAGAFEYNELKVHPKFLRLDFELEEARSYHVIIAVCIVLGIYFFLLVYAVQKNETIEDAVYLMSDVPADNRFAYLVIIKTGGRIDAGTSSDVVIQLFGTGKRSQEHVINFPDPLMELLQRKQKDYFVLASPVHLGRLNRLHLWFDCSGSSPTWYCEYIRICDLQTKQWYMFTVKNWFKIEGEPKVFISVPALSDKEIKYQKKKYQLLRSLLSFGRFDKTMWHLSTRSNDPNFGFPKRLTLILSVIISLMMITMVLYGRPEFKPRDTITPNCYFKLRPSIWFKGLYSALLTFFPHIAIMEGFKNSRLQFQSKTSKDSKALSPASMILLWFILISNIAIQLHVLMIFGYKMVKPTTLEWTVSTGFGLFLCVFVLDYLYNFFLVLVGGVAKPLKTNYDKIIRNIEKQRKILYQFIGRYIYRPILTPLYEVMSRADYARKLIHFRQRREMVWQVNDFFMMITFILLLYVIILAEKDTVYDVRGHEEALKLINGAKSTKHKLQNVHHIKDFESFMEKGLIPAIQSYQWYGRYITESPGMTTDACNKYLGVIRLRQHRVEEESCNVTIPMKFLNTTCRSPDYFFRYDFLNYTPAWNNTIPEFHRSRLGYVWGHQAGIGQMFFGLAGFYDSGGYVAYLGRTIENSYVNFNYLKRYNWLDPLTRAIIIEFCLYNVNKNHFHFAEVVLEKTPAGFINKDVTVKTERVVKYSTKSQEIALVFSIVFMGLVLGLCIRTVIRIIKTKVWYRSDLWHIVDVLIITLSLTWLGLYFKRLDTLREFVRRLEENPSNNFVDYFPILGVESWMRILAAVLICIATIRIWRIVRFGVIFRTVERTLMLSTRSLCIMLMYYIIFLVAFGVTMFVLLGSKVGKFRNEYYLLKSLVLISLGFDEIENDEVSLNERGLGYVFSVLYSVFSQFLTTLFIAVILVGYMEARIFAFEEKLEYNLKDYTIERYDLLKRMGRILAQKFRLTAGAQQAMREETVTPKDDVLRYKNCVQTDSIRMKAMASVAKCVLLKRQKGLRVDESDHRLMMRTVRNLCNKEEGQKQLFFMEGTPDSGFTMIDNRRLLMMERLVNGILETPESKARRMDMVNQEEALLADNLARMMKMNYELKLIRDVVKNIEVTQKVD
ncbi:uncharacterized protein LOC123313712 isoform X2 [Coccinella septempunctata]|uniref:uncharacterized protein LOC123313712 isoform X2 n=1 Tax=Coccinella septempunctata TaxID=41139 RepID=UPI001D08351B|nr:uncharacterized protein LOC123313712 isoform X2 [Coccinella septempunctata]